MFTTLGLRRDSVPVLMYDADGSLTDTIAVWPGSEVATTQIAAGRLLVPVGLFDDAGEENALAIGTDTQFFQL